MSILIVCDSCDAQEAYDSDSLPEGWISEDRSGLGPKHTCDICIADAEEEPEEPD